MAASGAGRDGRRTRRDGTAGRGAADWPYRRVTNAQCERLHRAAMSVLERTGVRLELPRAVELLRAAGARVDADGVVRMPADLVDWALDRVPRAFTIYDQAGEPAMLLDGERTYYGPGSDCLSLLDHRTGARRAPVMADVAAGVDLVDALPNVDYVMSLVLPTDVDNRVADRHQMRAMLTRTHKPIVLVTYEASGCYDAVAMAQAVAGGSAALAARPFLACYVNTATGLLHNADALEKVIFLAERGIPILYIPGSQAGVTGPATQAGAVTYFWAGVLTGLVLAQVVNEGAPVMTKGWGGGGLDMRTMVYGYASPDQRATAIALSRWADLPSFSLAGASDAKTVDQQAAAEAALTLAVEALAGPDVVHDLGYLESGLTYSFTQLAICDEIVGWLRHLRAPYDVSTEALALDLIDETGPGGQFLATSHTTRHFREHYYPSLFERATYEAWREKGGGSLADRAGRRVDEILDAAPAREPLACDDGLRAIVAAAERRVGA
jgi:trimethylamine---corrinoid protein Co-methyltransferase